MERGFEGYGERRWQERAAIVAKMVALGKVHAPAWEDALFFSGESFIRHEFLWIRCATNALKTRCCLHYV